MFVGLIGATYSEGVSAFAMMMGWVVDDYVAWVVGIPGLLRMRSEEGGSATIPAFLGQGARTFRFTPSRWASGRFSKRAESCFSPVENTRHEESRRRSKDRLPAW